jgi:hypothetical protein
MIGCTLAGDNVRADLETLSNGFGSPAYDEQGCARIFNTLSCLPMGPGNDKIKIRSSVVRTGSYFFPANTDSDATLVYADGGDLVLGEGFSPVIGVTPGIDLGDAALDNPYSAGTDLFGNQRVMNGAVDVGAVEADWRGVYAVRLDGKTRIRVTDVSPAVTDCEEEGCVLVPEGSLTVVVPVRPNAGPAVHEAVVSVSGGGVLTVYADDAVIATVTSGDGTITLTRPGGSDTVFRFSFDSGESGGAALIHSVKSRTAVGMTVVIR